MSLHLDLGVGAQIDSQIWDIYDHRLGGSELGQLAKLFNTSGLLARLDDVLTPTLPTPRPGYSEELELSLAWIDKRPLAKLATNPRRVELGDAAIFFFDLLQFSGKTHYRQSRAVILQAKVAKEKGQIAQPAVPVNPRRPRPNTSTARELELLSRWEIFDLYKTAGDRDPILNGISVAPAKFPPANGWYMATPKKRPNDGQNGAWKSPWMCAPAKDGAPCEVTLGNLLLAFLASSPVNGGNSSLPAVGVDFEFDPQYLLQPNLSAKRGNDWNRLCVKILQLCPKHQLPRSLFGAQAGPAIIRTTVLRSLPYAGDGSSLINLILWIRDELFPRRMPVLLITITRREG